MERENFLETLRSYQANTPFEPYAVELINGRRLVVSDPEMLAFRGGTAVYLAPGDMALFEHDGVKNLHKIDPAKSMNAETFTENILELTRLVPFRPFTVELVSGDRIEVLHPEALAVAGGTAAYVSPKGVARLFDHESVSQLIQGTGRSANGHG